jgi:hypothetical protein
MSLVLGMVATSSASSCCKCAICEQSSTRMISFNSRSGEFLSAVHTVRRSVDLASSWNTMTSDACGPVRVAHVA